MRPVFWFIGATVLAIVITGCGGGSGSAFSSPGGPPPAATFSVSLSSSAITVRQGGTQIVQVSITAQNGFTGSVSVTTIGLPSGVTVSPPSLSITAGTPGSFTFTASNTAGIAQQSARIEATAGSLTVDSALQFTVSGAAIADPFHTIGGAPTHGFYDSSRQLLFVTNPPLNELDVISAATFSVQARVTVPQAWGIDQMADNKTLVIGTAAQEIVTVDEDTLAVTPHPVTGTGQTNSGLFYPNVIATANGKVLIIGQEQGIDSNDIAEGGQFLVEWDSIANTFKIIEPTGQILWETDRLARSADHKWAIFSADQFYLYSSDTDTLTTVSLSAVNPPLNTFGVRGYAINADGTKIAVVSAGQVTFLDRSFNILGTTEIPFAFQTARTNVAFTPDGSRLLLQYSLPIAIEVIDANTHAALGYYSADGSPQDTDPQLLATDPAGRSFIGTSVGIRVLDLTATLIPNPTDPSRPLSGASCAPPSFGNAPLNTSPQLMIFASAGTSYYVNGQPAPLLSNATQIQIPPSAVPGPSDIECIGPDGNTFLLAYGFSYGVDAIGVSANLLPPVGNPSIFVFGYGFTTSPSGAPPSVNVGGLSALNVNALSNIGFGVLEGAVVQLPTQAASQTLDVTVSNTHGASTLAQGVTYIPSATVLPASGLRQVLYDTHRNLLYVLKAAEVDVLNPVTLQFQAPFPLPLNAGSANYNAMALSPDGTRLIAVSPDGYSAVLDPDNPSGASLVAGTGTPGFQNGSVAVTKFNKALISGFPNVEVDLSTLGVKTIPGHLGDLLRASADGNFLFGVDLNASTGEVYAIDPATYSAQTERFGLLFWTDLAVSADGSQFATIDGDPIAVGDIVGFFDPSLHLLNINEYPLVSPPSDVQVLGAAFGPLGKVLVMALGDSIEFWDTAKGTLRARLMTPEELQVLVFPEGPVAPRIALDSSGQTIFAISATGLTVMKLPQSVDSLPAQSWPFGMRPASAQLSSGLSARVAAMHATIRK